MTIKSMSLIEGTVLVTVKVKTLVSNDIISNKEKLNAIVEHLAYNEVIKSSDCEFNINKKVDVLVDKELSEEYEEEMISGFEWGDILARSNELLKSDN